MTRLFKNRFTAKLPLLVGAVDLPVSTMRNPDGQSESFRCLSSFMIGALAIASMLFLTPRLSAQPEIENGEAARMEFKEASWFVGEIATVWVLVNSKEEPVVTPIEDQDGIRFLDTEIIKLEDDNRGSFVVSTQFIPLRSGVRTIPSIQLQVDGESLSTQSRQVVVGEPYETESMDFKIEAEKTRVYVGEPIRLDFVWRCDLPMNQIRDLKLYPEFFSNESIEVVIPRSAAPEEEQFGLPIGGRRVIARRVSGEEAFPPNLGELRFAVYVRFERAGRFDIARTKLLCSRLLVENAQSNRYAAYFNNALFEPVDRSLPHEKLNTFSQPIEIDVLPLPGKGQLESFSGLFQVDSIDVALQPKSVEVGQLMEIRIDVNSSICSEMLQLPDLGRQASLRNRFWIGREVNEIWKPDGRVFVARARPLSVETTSFPSLSFQLFDPSKGEYHLVRTHPIPLEISVREGMTYFPIKNIPGAQNSVVGNAEGIWHNYQATLMSDLLHRLVNLLSDGIWIFVFLGPVLFFGFSFWAREARRRAIDETYRRRKEAYQRFKRAVSQGSDNVEALRLLVAECFNRKNSALTAKDVARLLRAARGERDLIQEIEEVIGVIEVGRYDPSDKVTRESIRTGKLGERVFRLFQRGLVSALMFAVLCGLNDLSAADWNRAEALFANALLAAESSEDSGTTESRFAEAALEFESCAESGIRSGKSWFNAGNAWFKAGEIGRSIACYRQAQIQLPFDEKIASSLEAARALRIDSFSASRTSSKLPVRWMKAAFSALWLTAFGLAVFWIRYQSKVWMRVTGTAFAVTICVGAYLSWDAVAGYDEAVLIVDEVYGRKGPSYSYVSAYADPLHNGLEVSIVENRKNWLRARLEDGTDCWLPIATVQVLGK